MYGHYAATPRHYICETCNGTGSEMTESGFGLPCHNCHGFGYKRIPDLPVWARWALAVMLVTFFLITIFVLVNLPSPT